MSRVRLLGEADPRPFRPPCRAGSIDPEEEKSRIRDAAQEGYEEGLRRGRAEGKAEFDRHIELQTTQLAETIDKLGQLRSSIIDKLADEVLSIALTAASRIVRVRIDSGDPVAVRIVDEALAQVRAHVPCKIHLNPDDYETVLALSTAVRGRGEGIELMVNPDLPRGSVSIDMADEEIDGRLQTALAALAEAALEEA